LPAGRTDVAACVVFSPDLKLTLPALAKTTAPCWRSSLATTPTRAARQSGSPRSTVGGRKPHAAKVFPGVGRGFHDPGAAKIYKADVAKQAWSTAIEHLDAHAKKPQT
jgi:hypothetical protein